jgi:chromosome partitioning protein
VPDVAFISPKGGAGKTTAALLLALGLADRGERVAIVDSDPNKPLVHWAALPGRPSLISVHPAPTLQDVHDAYREAKRLSPDWIILDTEGSVRGAMAFTTIRPNLVLTPLAGSQLEAVQAIRAWEMVEQFGGRSERRLLHRCVLTRIPAALRPRGLRDVVGQLRSKNIEFLPTPLFEKEAFRALFSTGGGLDEVHRSGVSGVKAARENAAEYVDAVVSVLQSPTGLARGTA